MIKIFKEKPLGTGDICKRLNQPEELYNSYKNFQYDDFSEFLIVRSFGKLIFVVPIKYSRGSDIRTVAHYARKKRRFPFLVDRSVMTKVAPSLADHYNDTSDTLQWSLDQLNQAYRFVGTNEMIEI